MHLILGNLKAFILEISFYQDKHCHFIEFFLYCLPVLVTIGPLLNTQSPFNEIHHPLDITVVEHI